uniref:Uncharacterized protein n=1 Tax=Rhizophora mucronata TaxID=61149 RepID=A0A2P2PRT5_RHIMU
MNILISYLVLARVTTNLSKHSHLCCIHFLDMFFSVQH